MEKAVLTLPSLPNVRFLLSMELSDVYNLFEAFSSQLTCLSEIIIIMV